MSRLISAEINTMMQSTCAYLTEQLFLLIRVLLFIFQLILQRCNLLCVLAFLLLKSTNNATVLGNKAVLHDHKLVYLLDNVLRIAKLLLHFQNLNDGDQDLVHQLLPDILVGGALVLLVINRSMQLLSQVGDIVLAKA